MYENEYRSQLPELGTFLDELGLVLENATKFGMPDVCWSANVLLSIDQGYDAPGVAVDIAKQMIAGGVTFRSTQVPAVQSFSIPASPEKAELMWNQAFAFIEKCSIAERSSGKRIDDEPLVFSFDLSDCISGIGGKDIHDRLKMLSDIKGRFIYIFRVPYLDGTALGKVKTAIADIFPLRVLSIAPLSDDALTAYLHQRLEQKGVVIKESTLPTKAGAVDSVIAEMIAYEKADGRFDGLATMNKLADSIVYLKLASMKDPTKKSKAGSFRVTIDAKELAAIYADMKGQADSENSTLLDRLTSAAEMLKPGDRKIGF
ncbi:MAG: hypothetical protein IJH41_05675 [Eubacterium sp.]|nr:hypothetical protein [Eubacterium sp.]